MLLVVLFSLASEASWMGGLERVDVTTALKEPLEAFNGDLNGCCMHMAHSLPFIADATMPLECMRCSCRVSRSARHHLTAKGGRMNEA
jgi:hypothetical protein